MTFRGNVVPLFSRSSLLIDSSRSPTLYQWTVGHLLQLLLETFWVVLQSIKTYSKSKECIPVSSFLNKLGNTPMWMLSYCGMWRRLFWEIFTQDSEEKDPIFSKYKCKIFFRFSHRLLLKWWWFGFLERNICSTFLRRFLSPASEWLSSFQLGA